MSPAAAQPPTRPPLAGHPAEAASEREAPAPAAAAAAARRTQADLDIPPAPLGLVALWDLWKKTTGSLSLDLSRRKMRCGAPGDSLWRVSAAPVPSEPAGRRRGRPPARPKQPGYAAPPPGTYAAPGAYGGSYGTAQPGSGLVDLPSLSFMDTGARIKVMRHVQFGPKVEVQRSSGLIREVPSMDFGVGLAFEVDTAELQPQASVARLKFRDLASLKALPYPSLKIQKRLRWPDSTWGVRLSYECPLDSLATFYRPPARLMLSIDNMHSNGVQLTQAGLEFNFAQVFGQQRQAELRASGLVSLPRELPIVEGQALAGLEIKRLGLKTQW
ncbi:hypothetical protein ABPG75_005925 [Micractinium tetrahymenae]